MGSKNLERRELVGEIWRALLQSRHVLLSAPPAYGKTSLIQLIKQQCCQPGISIERVSLLDPSRTAREIVLDATGIDIMQGLLPVSGEKYVIIALDEAQQKYDDLDFWHALIKNLPQANITGTQFRFLISATDYIRGTFAGSSPASFGPIPRFDRERLRLTDIEAAEVYDMHIRPHLCMPSVRSIILNSAGGHIGVIRLSTMSLNWQFKIKAPSVTEVMQDVFSKRFLPTLDRCFGSITSLPVEVADKLRQQLLMPAMQSLDVDSKPIKALMRCGYLTNGDDGLAFASLIAKRFACALLFPGRASLDAAPETLSDLICAVMTGMSANLIDTISSPDGRFPVETAWQHLFMARLAEKLPPSVTFVPELARYFPHTDEEARKIPGSVDLYVNGSLRWGIELVINGDRLGEHLELFEPSGKYAPLDLRDYRTVDIRYGNPTRVERHKHRTTVWFPKATAGNPRVCLIQDGVNQDIPSFNLPL